MNHILRLTGFHWLTGVLKLTGVIALSLLVSACSVTPPVAETDSQKAASTHIGQFIWHDLVTEDLAASKSFYAALFGWTFEDVSRVDGRPYSLIKLNGDYIAGVIELEKPTDGRNISRWLGYLSVADIDVALSDTQNAGGSLVLPAKAIKMIGSAAAIEDPEGAVLGLLNTDLDYPDPGMARGAGRIVWNELLAADPERAVTFYRTLGKLDARLISRRGGEYRMLQSNGVDRAGIMANPLAGTPSVWLTYFSVDDPAKMADRAQALGAKILIPASASLREGSMALIADPTGAILVLQKEASQTAELTQ